MTNCVLQPAPQGLLLRIKVVPNASRTRVVGVLGDRLKLQVAAAPEAGRANRAVCELLAEILRIPARNVSIIAGQGQPAKTALIAGANLAAVAAALQIR